MKGKQKWKPAGLSAKRWIPPTQAKERTNLMPLKAVREANRPIRKGGKKATGARPPAMGKAGRSPS